MLVLEVIIMLFAYFELFCRMQFLFLSHLRLIITYSQIVLQSHTDLDHSIGRQHSPNDRLCCFRLLILGTIYRVTLLTLQVSMHLEVVFNVWTSVITSRVTVNFYTYCLFLLVLVGYRAIVSAFRCLLVLFHPSISHCILCLFLCLEQIKLS